MRNSGEDPTPDLLRLQVYLSRAGLGSRRSCEDLIREGRVQVNGEPAELGMKVRTDDDVVVDGRSINPLRLQWIALNKPTGYVTTRDDPSGRRTVYDLLPSDLHHLFHVGRLDRDSSGLLLLSNDGTTANRLLHPRYETIKEYRVDVAEPISEETIATLLSGVRLDDGLAAAVEADYVGRTHDGEYRLILHLAEGRNREVRRMMEAVGHPVVRLFRQSFGPIRIGRLKKGEWRRLSPAEIRTLRSG